MLKPFFCFFGGKWRDALSYPAPRYDMVIEPFAGAAGYATRYHERKVVLVEADPVIAALWRWLIAASCDDILRLPITITTTDNLAPEPAALIGFWLNKGTATPCRTPSKWMRDGLRPNSFWGEVIRARIADQVGAIKHWTIIEGDFADGPEDEATRFVDPPYQKAGKCYRKKFTDFARLASFARGARGQTIVCEQEGADWLPFTPHRTTKANESRTGGKRSPEVMWYNEACPSSPAPVTSSAP